MNSDNSLHPLRLPFGLGALLLLVVLSGVSCATQSVSTVDWVDFVQFNGIQYLAQYDTSLGVGRALQQSDLGPAFAKIKFKLAGNVGAGYHIQDGDAADLDVGTTVFTVKGYQSTFRLAAIRSGNIVRYEADVNPTAKKGADLLDIEGKVQSIQINSWTDSQKKLGVITDTKEVEDLVKMVLVAPVDQQLISSGDATYVIIFILKDGTTVSRTYFTSTGELLHHILLPNAFTIVIESAVHH